MGERRSTYRALVGEPEEKEHLEYLGVDGRIILKWILKKWNRSMDCFDLAQGRCSRWALVNALTKHQVS
jgi:hypothetical protein